LKEFIKTGTLVPVFRLS